MRRVIGTFMLLVLLAGAVAAQDSSSVNEPPAGTEAEEVYSQSKMMFALKRANVRAGPSTDHVRTGLLEVGERVTVVARVGDWFQLRHRQGQSRRFVYAPLLTDVQPATSKPSAAQSTASTSTMKTLAYDGGQYRGPTRNGRPHGRGVVTYSDGDRFEGEFVNGKRHGHGVEFYADGSRYEGEFVAGQYTDYGSVVWANGNRYEGEWRGDERTGRGVFTWANGSRYEGDFVDGSLTGRGVFTSADGDHYGGEWHGGKRTGRGVMSWADGRRYEGDWQDNKRHGRGAMRWADGARYEGEWRDGKANGRGVKTWASGHRYEGDYRDGKRHGRGVYTWGDGRRYEGDWRDNKRHGRGVYTWADGDSYDGEWQDDMKHGVGIIGGPVTALSAVLYHQDEVVTSAPLDGGVTDQQSQTQRQYWGAYIEVGSYVDGQGFTLTWNHPDPQSALEYAYERCLEKNSYALCGGNDLERDYGLQYWLFSTSKLPTGTPHFPDPLGGVEEHMYRFDVKDSVFATYHADTRCIAVCCEGSDDLERRFRDTKEEAMSAFNSHSGFDESYFNAVECNTR